MAWWTVGIDGDEVGDQPANLLELALDEFSQACRAAGKPRPTPQALLEAFARSLARQGLAQGIVERADGRPEALHTAKDDGDPDVLALADAVTDKLRECYRRYRSRDARATEICAVIAFVLRHQPERFLSQARDWNLHALRPADLVGGAA
ncbi:MAG TPA: hypothetical protein VGC16_04085 [Rhizomicrobium sp.]